MERPGQDEQAGGRGGCRCGMRLHIFLLLPTFGAWQRALVEVLRRSGATIMPSTQAPRQSRLVLCDATVLRTPALSCTMVVKL